MRTLITGANGFVGRRLVQLLAEQPVGEVLACVRNTPAQCIKGVQYLTQAPSLEQADWPAAMTGVSAVVHLAARVHMMNDQASDPLQAFRNVNVEGTVRLAEAAAAGGVKRFVFVSSVKVNGESTVAGRPFKPSDAAAPVDPYGVSKHEAETALHALGQRTGMEVVVVRPTLVYGPGVKANFRSMMGWLHRGIPLPLGAIDNRRSLVAQDNLCSLIQACLQHPDAPGHTFLASDGEDVSTTELLRRLGLALGRPARLLPVPPGVLRLALGALGKSSIAHRLLGSLQVDSSSARTVLGWQPPLTLDQGLQRAAASFLAEKQAA